MIAQHPAGPSVVLLKGKCFQMPIQRSRVKVPVLLHSQMLEVAYLGRFWPFKSKHIITESLSLLGTERPHLASLRFGFTMNNGIWFSPTNGREWSVCVY